MQKLPLSTRHTVVHPRLPLSSFTEVLARLDALRLEQAATAAKVDAIAAAAPQQEHVTSPALLASRTLEVLRAATLAATGRTGVFDFADSAGPPVLDEQQLVDLRAARDMDKEVGIIRYLPHTHPVGHCRLLLD